MVVASKQAVMYIMVGVVQSLPMFNWSISLHLGLLVLAHFVPTDHTFLSNGVCIVVGMILHLFHEAWLGVLRHCNQGFI